MWYKILLYKLQSYEFYPIDAENVRGRPGGGDKIWRMQRGRFLDASLTRTTRKADRWLCKEDPCSRHCCMCIICVGHYTDSRHGSLLVVSFRFAAFFSDYIRIAPFDFVHHIYNLDFRIRVIIILEGEGEGDWRKVIMVNIRKIMTVWYAWTLNVLWYALRYAWNFWD